MTNGPRMLFLEVNGKEPGTELRLGGPAEVQVTARATSQISMTSIEIVVNGEVVASGRPSRGRQTGRDREEVEVPRSSWIAARVSGDGHRLVVNDPKLFAHTSPVYCYVGSEKIKSREDARMVLAWIDRLIQDVVGIAAFRKRRASG